MLVRVAIVWKGNGWFLGLSAMRERAGGNAKNCVEGGERVWDVCMEQ